MAPPPASRLPPPALKPVGIIVRRRFDARSHRSDRRLSRYDFSELRGEIRLHVFGSRDQRRVARLDHFVVRVESGDLLHPREGDGWIERAKRTEHRDVERNIGSLRILL